MKPAQTASPNATGAGPPIYRMDRDRPLLGPPQLLAEWSSGSIGSSRKVCPPSSERSRAPTSTLTNSEPGSSMRMSLTWGRCGGAGKNHRGAVGILVMARHSLHAAVS
ncbi:hypothetical protein FRACA_840022 [Frankia canadensis]|uniref:Uncharacterized protein n=1 Tax=Frankia canadensis TaxID=1836972 RepID=A0A2I2L1U0_9ACTN|nr:hypothetical protein FRACA_840022 [Frankia canadensis]SOU59174.1 hypothetical protein FRACA_840022 [Frankia canadensis]